MLLGRKAVVAQLRGGERLQPGEHAVHLVGGKLAHRLHLRLHIVVLDVGHDEPDGRIDPGIERHDQPGHPQVARDAGRMHRPGAPEGEQHEVAQVVAAHGRDRLDGLLHLDLDDPHDAFGGRDAGRCRAARRRSLVTACAGPREVEAHLAAEEIVLAQMPQDQIAVRDGRQLAAAAVAGRSRAWRRRFAARPAARRSGRPGRWCRRPR